MKTITIKEQITFGVKPKEVLLLERQGYKEVDFWHKNFMNKKYHGKDKVKVLQRKFSETIGVYKVIYGLYYR